MRTRILALALLLVALTAHGDRGMTYVFKRGDSSISRMHDSLESFMKIKDRWRGDFIWVSTKGRQYLIRDPKIIAEANVLFRELDALEPALRAAEERFRPLEEKLDALSDADDEDNEAEIEVLERRMRPIEAELERLENEMEKREKGVEARFEKLIERVIARGQAQRVK